MNVKYLNVGIIHSLIGKNDGVSIVIDQTVNAMVDDMQIPLGNIFFLAAHTSPRFNAQTDDVFWHKNLIHQKILARWNEEPSDGMDEEIHKNALYAKQVIKEFIEENDIDLIIPHNTSHCFNFITAVGLGYYIEELREKGLIWPKILVWWHDSHFERERFKSPNPVIQKYLKYLPGTYVDAIAFINRTQPAIAKRLFEQYNAGLAENFFKERIVVVPNTTDIPWKWEELDWESETEIQHPPKDNYNDSFFRDIGLLDELEKINCSFDQTVLLLQHTRIVPRKKIENAIDLAFLLEEKYREKDEDKCVALIVSGHSGDEQEAYKVFLMQYFHYKFQERPGAKVVLVFGEHCILSHRDIIVDKKYYRFAEVPAIIASHGGVGTYFSEVEGYGNNLLEMMCYGMPVVINEYEIYKTDIEHLGFSLPSVKDNILTPELVDQAYDLLNNVKVRNKNVKHNLDILHEKLRHEIIAGVLSPLIQKMYRYTLR